MNERGQYCPNEANEKGTKGEIVKTTKLSTRAHLTVLACLILTSQPAGAQISQEKQHVLDWLSEPEKNVAVICRAMETEIPPDDEAELARFRQHRDFILALARLVPPGARLWLHGWLEAVAHGAFAAPDIPF